MQKKALFICLYLGFTVFVFSQKSNEENILSIDGENVSVEEFQSVYTKNLELVQDEDQKDKEKYLELFINYKLKVREAIALGLDKEPSFLKEFKSYQTQLSENHLYDQNITKELVLQAYQRTLEEVSANHILILVGENAKPADTIEAYNKIKNIWEKAKQGEDFEALARMHSEEPNAKESAGKLGYFKGFSMVYPFENAAYNTPVGEISNIVRTRFGYHIIKINDRRVVPDEVTVAHIMIALKEGVSEEEAKSKILELQQKIKQGEDFGLLAKQFSEDASTARNEGKLTRFGSGRLNAPSFEAAAFALENPGDVSQPIKTDFGWHLIMLHERHSKQTFEEAKEELTSKIKQNERSKIIVASVNDAIKQKYGFTENKDVLPFFNTFVSDSILKRKWDYDSKLVALNDKIFSIGTTVYTYEDFAAFLKERQKRAFTAKEKEELLSAFYTEFQEQKLRDFFMQTLEKENKEYASVLTEYRNGLLIFDVMQKMIWEPSKTDSLGLENYFIKNKQNYKWDTRVDAVVYSTADKNVAIKIKALLEESKTEEQIKEALNTEDYISVISTKGIFEMGHPALPQNFKSVKGISKIYPPIFHTNTKTEQYNVVLVKDVLAPSFRDLDGIRGKVMSDYQNYLEEEWMKELKKKYTVKVNKKALK